MTERIAPGVAHISRNRSRPPGGARCPSSPKLDRDGVHRRGPRRGARHGRSRAGAARASRGRARCCCTTIPAGTSSPRGADLAVAARLHDDGVGLRHHRQRRHAALRGGRGAAGRSRDAARSAVAWSPQLGEHGPVARALGQLRGPPEPARHGAHIADAYNDGGVLLLEAGTGVGKSFAYLVPALAWARANGERTVVSTNTINLQEQLVGKDLPFLRDALAHRGSRAVLRAAQGMAQLPLPRAAAPGGGRAAHAARARQAATS